MRLVPTSNPLLHLVKGRLLQFVNLIKPCAVDLKTTKAVEVFILIETLSHKDKLAAVVECYNISISVPTSNMRIKPIAKQASECRDRGAL